MDMRFRFRDTYKTVRTCLRTWTGVPERGASLTEAVLWAAVAAALIVVIIGIINSWATGLMNSLPGVPGT